MKLIASAAAIALTAGLANAQTWNEVGDAGNLAGGQAVAGSGSIAQILGNLDATGDVDMFSIRVTNWAAFSADLRDITGLVSPETDTQLFLFDSAGYGIAFNDDEPSPGTGLRSFMPAGNAVYSGRTNGEVVWIAVSGYNVDPAAAGSAIWLNSPFNTVRAPDGAGAAGIVDAWSGTGSAGTYRIALTGAEAIPTPGALALAGAAGLVLARRRRA